MRVHLQHFALKPATTVHRSGHPIAGSRVSRFDFTADDFSPIHTSEEQAANIGQRAIYHVSGVRLGMRADLGVVTSDAGFE